MTDVEAYARAWRDRLAAERAAHAELAESARAGARRCAEVLVQEFGATRVRLFGSLSRRRSAPFGPRSDVDLAVEGLAPSRHWVALRALAEGMPPGVAVDLVPVEDATPSVRRRIEQTGATPR